MPTITYNIPPEKQADVLAALRAHYGAPNATAQQINDLLAADLKAKVKGIYREHMRKNATFDLVLD